MAISLDFSVERATCAKRVDVLRRLGIPGLPWPSHPARQAVPPASHAPPVPPEAPLHSSLWRADQLACAQGAVLSSNHAMLDAQLPGGGWPARALTELLLPHPGVGELRLLAPVLTALQRQQRSVMWLDPPAAPCGQALSALGIDLRQLVVVHARAPLASGPARGAPPQPLAVPFAEDGLSDVFEPLAGGPKSHRRQELPAADILWALEQALKSGHLGAVLAWLPNRLPADALRRLQLAAQAHDGPVFLLRDAQMRGCPSPAPLRLLLASAGPDLLRVAVFKRRGPPQDQPLTLALAPVLSRRALARALAKTQPPAKAAPNRVGTSTAAAKTPPETSAKTRAATAAPPTATTAAAATPAASPARTRAWL